MSKKIKIIALKKLLKESENNMVLRSQNLGHPHAKGNPKQIYGKSQLELNATEEEESEDVEEIEEESEDVEVSKAFKQE